MSEQEGGRWIPSGDQVAAELRSAVHAGDVEAIRRLLRGDPALATARLVGRRGGTGTPLHLVADWPGYFPNGPQVVRLLVDAGADPNALTTSQGAQAGPGSETPLHYAAIHGRLAAVRRLLELGADVREPPADRPPQKVVVHVDATRCTGRLRRLPVQTLRVDHQAVEIEHYRLRKGGISFGWQSL